MIEIGNFTREHVAATLGLSTSVNWNHIEEDWFRLLELNPEGCIGGFLDGELIATCSVSKYDDMGWVGTFLVDEQHRRKGYGSVVFAAMLERAGARGCEWLGIDSTDAGRPIYARNGFVEDEPIERWAGPNREGAGEGTEPLADDHWPSLLALDRASIGVGRERQLRRLAAEPGARVRVVTRGNRVTAFGFSRPGRIAGCVGPVVAESFDDAAAVIRALLADRRAADGERGVAIDVLGGDAFKALMTELGFKELRRLIRMFRPSKKRAVFSGPNVYAATALGMG